MKVTQQIANFVANTDYEDFPPEVLVRAKELVLDCLGVTIAGNTTPIGQIVVQVAKQNGEQGDATIMGNSYATSVLSASFLNSTLAHALDMDDTAINTIAHPSASILPALLALAEKYRFSGKELLTAYILGLEVFYRVALASEGLMMGWHRSSVFGAIATAIASAKLLRLNIEKIQTAIGISTSLASGLQVNFGTMTKAVQVGNASRSGLLAAMLAKEGCTASYDALENARGFGYAFYSGQFVPEKVTAELGNPFSILFPGVGVKIYPCCGLTHTPADITLRLVGQHGIHADDVDKIMIYTEELASEVLVYHRPKTGYEGKYSLEYVTAAAVLDGEIGLHTFADDKVNRPEIRTLIEKVECRTRSDSDWAQLKGHSWNHPASVTIRLKDGRVYSGEAPCAHGYPDMPLTKEESIHKYQTCAKLILPADRIECLSEKVFALEAQNDIAMLMALTRP